MPSAPRLVLLFAFVMALPFLGSVYLIALLALAIPAVFLMPATRSGLWRIRWLLFALFVLYGLFMPGSSLEARLFEALPRIAVLVCAVVAVQLALAGMAAEELADGLIMVLAPFRVLRLPVDAFARRLTLTLDSVPRVQAIIAATPAPSAGNPLAQLAERAAAVIIAIEREAEAH